MIGVSGAFSGVWAGLGARYFGLESLVGSLLGRATYKIRVRIFDLCTLFFGALVESWYLQW